MPADPKQVCEKILLDIAEQLAVMETKRQGYVEKAAKEGARKPTFFKDSHQKKVQETNLKSASVLEDQRVLKSLNTALTATATALSDDPHTAISQIREVMLVHYIDLTAKVRLVSKENDLLTALQTIILNATPNSADNFLLKNAALAVDKGKPGTTDNFDARFLASQYAIEDPELPKVVEHIFNGYVQSSVGLQQEQQANYMKALSRVGLDVAPSIWNELVSLHLGNRPDNAFRINVQEVQAVRANPEILLKSYFISANDHPEVARYLGPVRASASTSVASTSSVDLVTQSRPERTPTINIDSPRTTPQTPPPFLSESNPVPAPEGRSPASSTASTGEPATPDSPVTRSPAISTSELLARYGIDKSPSPTPESPKSAPTTPPPLLSGKPIAVEKPEMDLPADAPPMLSSINKPKR